jgi:hypothetical protein
LPSNLYRARGISPRNATYFLWIYLDFLDGNSRPG